MTAIIIKVISIYQMEERPFDPSAKKLRQARQKAEVPQSQLLTMAVSTTFTLGVLGLVHSSVVSELAQMMSQGLQGKSINCFPLVGWMLLLLATPWISALLITLLQTGGLFSWYNLKPRWRKRTNLLSWEQISFMSIKMAILTAVLALFLKFAQLCEGVCATKKLYQLALSISCIFVVLGILDWRYRNWQFHQRKRMTFSEKKEEKREDETSKLTRQRRQTLQERE